ncbi:UNVERIFIED_CONTAM: hypothetical protein PYX00_008422 [Menopon gallinae]|uniref:Nose resistant-to-fluoxetine protein N-terminal domain-containing protein n=1 Tax=Menopon gallinae TaxID=328185 RepID=A0AAW2HP22_9NEOP
MAIGIMWAVLTVCAVICECGWLAAATDSDGLWERPWRMYPAALPIADTSSENRQCRRDSELLLDGLKKERLWALKMWDSSAKSPVGLLFGATYQLGNFDECMTVMTPVRAQFCVAKVHTDIPQEYSHPKRPYDLHPDPETNTWEWIRSSRIDVSKVSRDVVYWGLCVPASCTNSDTEKSINSYLRRTNHTRNRVEIAEEFCTIAGEQDEVSWNETSFWTFTAFLVFLTVTSTMADNPEERKLPGSTISKLWMSFSMKRNMSLLTHNSTKPGALDFSYGIKVLCSSLVVIAHRLYYSSLVSPVNAANFEETLRSGVLYISNIGEVGVDVFFFAGAFFAAYHLLKQKNIGIQTLFRKITNRILRFAPVYYYLIWYTASAMSRFGSGPLWKAEFKKHTDFCSENWWTNVLFLNNYVNTTRACNLNWWYIPAELHLYVLVTFVSYAIAKNRKFGVILLAVLNVIAFLIPVLAGYHLLRRPVTLFFPDILRNLRNDFHFNTFYVKSHNRGNVSLIAVAAAYFYVENESKKRYSKAMTYIILLTSLVFIFVPTYMGFPYYDPNTQYTQLEAALYLPVRRLTSAIGFSLLTIAFTLGTLVEKSPKGEKETYIGAVNRAISSKFAVVYSKLTFIIYLAHFGQIEGDVAQQRTPLYYSTPEVTAKGILDNIRTALFSVAVFLMIEAPFKTILQGRSREKEDDVKGANEKND